MKTLSTSIVGAILFTIVGSSANADACDYKPSKLIGEAATYAVGGATAAATGVGAAMKGAGFYTLVHSSSGAVMLGSTAAGSSAAGTVGIVAGTSGAAGAVGSVLMAPVTLIVGGITLAAGGIYEGICYFGIEKVTDPYQVREIVEDIVINDPFLEIIKTPDGDVLKFLQGEEQGEYFIRNLYISDFALMHRDWFLNTNLGPVVYAVEAKPE